MAQTAQTGPLTIQHGHTEDQVLLQFSRHTDHLTLTPAQAEAFISSMRHSMEKLAEYQEKKAKGN